MHVRHEEAAAFAAAGDAGVTGELAVCAASCGPGNLHLINGLFDANRSRVPVLAIAAHIPRDEIGGSYFQETHPQELFRECSVYCRARQHPGAAAARPRDRDAPRGRAERRRRRRRPGRDLPAPAPIPRRARRRSGEPAPVITPDGRRAPRRRPSCSTRPGASRSSPARAARARTTRSSSIADALAAPVVHAMRGKEFVEYDNPNDVGMTGLLGFASGYRAMEHCDALLMLGTDFPYRSFFPERSHAIVQVDIRGEHIGRRVQVDVPLVGSVKDTIDALLPRLRRGRDTGHLDRMRDHYRRTRARLDALARAHGDGSPMHPQILAARSTRRGRRRRLHPRRRDARPCGPSRYLRMNGRRRLIGSFAHGSMANALAAGRSARRPRHPDRQVIALSGDGGLAMLLGELLTLRQHRLPVKVVVFNNSALAFVELEMKANGIVTYGTDLDNPSFAELAPRSRAARRPGRATRASSTTRCARRSPTTARR